MEMSAKYIIWLDSAIPLSGEQPLYRMNAEKGGFLCTRPVHGSALCLCVCVFYVYVYSAHTACAVIPTESMHRRR